MSADSARIYTEAYAAARRMLRSNMSLMYHPWVASLVSGIVDTVLEIAGIEEPTEDEWDAYEESEGTNGV